MRPNEAETCLQFPDMDTESLKKPASYNILQYFIQENSLTIYTQCCGGYLLDIFLSPEPGVSAYNLLVISVARAVSAESQGISSQKNYILNSI